MLLVLRLASHQQPHDEWRGTGLEHRQKGGPDHTEVLLLCVFILLPSVNRLSKGGMIRKERIKEENLEARDSNGGPGG